ncbi:Alpha/Beta hydrolase protein [Neohortaea acidophila]|uniref:Alpha/Beta hydrolase protein n=1 Tax=Neohortaea acidophila TaxID=245834 RepID=A0A6A6Q7M6_9PEZI|nr:Alpha/Beta hydrolase protein [Neohortaea acidophila]KAF2487653.1 Alpha/Beta hydrolase protein [Neohortaea acidophila]
MSSDDALRPEWLAFEKDLGFRPKLHGPTYEDILQQAQANGPRMLEVLTFPKPDTTLTTAWHETASGVRLKSYIPPTYRPDRPLIYYIHGGGFVLGSVAQDDSKVTPLCTATGCVFVSVEYRLAPQHPFPAGFQDCVEGAAWCLENAERLGARKGPIILMGKSAGGAFALGTALKWIDEGRGQGVLGVVACQPVTVHPTAVPERLRERYTAHEENAENTTNTRDAMRAFYRLHNAPLDDPYVWPLLHSNLKALPRVYLNACGADTLRDDARLLQEVLQQTGVPNRFDEFAGLPHYFFAFPSHHTTQLREDYYSRTAKGIEWVIDGVSKG